MDKLLKNKKIKIHSKDIEFHEIFLDKLAKEKETETEFSEKKLEIPFLKRAFQTFFFISIFIIGFLFFKTFQLQIIEGRDFTNQARANKYVYHKIQSQRGVIYDRNLKQIVFNKFSFDLICRKNELPKTDKERKKILIEISKILEIEFQDLEKKILNNEPAILVAENLELNKLIILETRIKQFPGFQIIQNFTRDYPNGENFSHLIGYLGKIKKEELEAEPDFYTVFDYVGQSGIEKSYEKILRQNAGKLQIEKDVLGNEITKEIISLPKPGDNLVLWLDSDLQEKIKIEMEKTLQQIGSKAGAVVAMDPKTGGILALLSFPSFDNNLFNKNFDSRQLTSFLQDSSKPFFDRVVSGQYPTGSTIKPLIALAGLEEKIISPDDEINCHGLIRIKNPYYQPGVNPEYYEYRDWKSHGITDLKKAIAKSCNVYFYRLGGGFQNFKGLGPERIKRYLELFGWGKKTEIDIPEEKNGFLPSPDWKQTYFKKNQDKIWRIGDTYNFSIGQGYVLATPLQVASAFAAVANNGKLFQPQIVQKIIDSEKNTIREFNPKIVKENFVDFENIQIVKQGMREGVIYGSSVILNDLPIKAACKTGTAEINKKNHYHSWATVFAPYEDPQIVLVIMIEDVRGLNPAALKTAKPILEWYFKKTGLIKNKK